MPAGGPTLRIHLTRLSTEGLGPRHGEVRRADQLLNAALSMIFFSDGLLSCNGLILVSRTLACTFFRLLAVCWPGAQSA